MRRKSAALLASSAVLASCVAAPSAGEDTPPDSTSAGTSCGVYSLAILHDLERGSSDLDVINSRLDGRQVHSMADLRDASGELGVALQGITLDARDWPLDRPAICFLRHDDSGHFAVIRPVGHTGRLVQVIDAIRGVETKDAATFFTSRDWTGNALVPTRLNDKLWFRAFINAAVGLACCGGIFAIYKKVLRRGK